MKIDALLLCGTLVAACGSEDVTVGSSQGSESHGVPSGPTGPGLEGPGTMGTTGTTGNNASSAPGAPCPPGQVQTWRYVQPVGYDGGFFSKLDRIEEGPGGAPMTSSCEVHNECQAGQAAVLTPKLEWTGGSDINLTETYTVTCTSAAPQCASGTSPEYIPEMPVYADDGVSGTSSGGTRPGQWRCSGKCELMVSYGAMFGDRFVCTTKPNLTCSGGDVPTFIVETETWECQKACNGGKYDPATFEGTNFCVPC